MNASPERQTAKILPFPMRGRASAAILSNKDKFAAELASLRTLDVAGETAWYHEAAIDETARDRRH
jgi:hypothetical protein